MTAVLLFWQLCLIPKFIPPALSHSRHVPPANPTLTLAPPIWGVDLPELDPSLLRTNTPQCVVKKSANGKITVRVCWANSPLPASPRPR